MRSQAVTSWSATGADISSHQHDGGAPNWSAYTDEFVIVKATEGATYTNPWYAHDVENARAAGKTVGHYHFLCGTPGEGGHAASVIKPLYQPGDIVWLDYEETANHAQLDTCRAAVRAAGMRTGTYTYPNWWANNGDPSCGHCASDPLWFAWYNPAPIDVPAPWRSVALWQYAGTSVRVPGLPGLNDHNRLLDPSLMGDDVTPQDIQAIAEAVMDFPLRDPVDGSEIKFRQVIYRLNQQSVTDHQRLADVVKAVAQAKGVTDPDALAAAVVDALGAKLAGQ